tara:strand:+ start:956 stop:1288 length:333 start_codon:yes stop_codon:yes gene_type:complete
VVCNFICIGYIFLALVYSKVERMKPGNLVCYNAAGQKHKTLGLVIETKSASQSLFSSAQDYVLIQWCSVGEFMPRRSNPPFSQDRYDSWHDIFPGNYVWHLLGNWFEEVS